MRAAVFVEGKCEYLLLKFFAQSVLFSAVTSDVMEYVKSKNQNLLLIYDCGGNQNVVPQFVDHFNRNWGGKIICICDLEKRYCFSSLKKEFTDSEPKIENIYYKFTLFAKPCIEALYKADTVLFSKVIYKIYLETHGNHGPPELEGQISLINWENPLPLMRSICTDFNLPFNKRKISEKFFSQFNYENANLAYFERLKEIFSVK